VRRPGWPPLGGRDVCHWRSLKLCSMLISWARCFLPYTGSWLLCCCAQPYVTRSYHAKLLALCPACARSEWLGRLVSMASPVDAFTVTQHMHHQAHL
jgi:hypothetical protein